MSEAKPDPASEEHWDPLAFQTELDAAFASRRALVDSWIPDTYLAKHGRQSADGPPPALSTRPAKLGLGAIPAKGSTLPQAELAKKLLRPAERTRLGVFRTDASGSKQSTSSSTLSAAIEGGDQSSDEESSRANAIKPRHLASSSAANGHLSAKNKPIPDQQIGQTSLPSKAKDALGSPETAGNREPNEPALFATPSPQKPVPTREAPWGVATVPTGSFYGARPPNLASKYAIDASLHGKERKKAQKAARKAQKQAARSRAQPSSAMLDEPQPETLQPSPSSIRSADLTEASVRDEPISKSKARREKRKQRRDNSLEMKRQRHE
ncbi:uncharacterized protein L969DRAFT_573720 [Mixia osmundae IAM 14324]|uniref:Uncharacterized protein n=1 Tax=Mixia osmundae (strain CBS 9802 / IAM 14324 / JCM 22182 / KY 12970) TaxID=764103 RepID=G7DS73_MIXOS|nr:uncharacterized protein L969DRAFT_573720 [Mixia osmundae IAM 14324]KEI37514.1 hypothetical protein L969DRAFT_573720 [Mixia osmundae IAM 14324]GAA93433.1 hypothetical protein E5Q_00074 [Mixia osmundae IAM 14324]